LSRHPVQLDLFGFAGQRDGATVAERLGYAFRLSTSRSARPAELEILLTEHRDRLAESTDGPSKAAAFLAGGGAQVELAAHAAVVSLILNLDESISKC